MNKNVLATIFLFGLSNAHPFEQRFTCPVDDCEISQCLYPNPDNCNSFWQCTPDGRTYLKHCLLFLEWNDFIKVCDWPSSQTCIPGLQPTPRPTTEGGADTTTESSTDTTTGQTSEDTTTESSTQDSTEPPLDTETSTEGNTETTTGANTVENSSTTELSSNSTLEEIVW